MHNNACIGSHTYRELGSSMPSEAALITSSADILQRMHVGTLRLPHTVKAPGTLAFCAQSSVTEASFPPVARCSQQPLSSQGLNLRASLA
jgi:hypothetical protein